MWGPKYWGKKYWSNSYWGGGGLISFIGVLYFFRAIFDKKTTGSAIHDKNVNMSATVRTEE